MKIKEYLSLLDGTKKWDDEERRLIEPLCNMLCPVSIKTLMEFQTKWFSGDYRPYDEFTSEQDQLIKSCVELEISPTGEIVREQFGLSPLTMETEVPDGRDMGMDTREETDVGGMAGGSPSNN